MLHIKPQAKLDKYSVLNMPQESGLITYNQMNCKRAGEYDAMHCNGRQKGRHRAWLGKWVVREGHADLGT